MTGGGEADPGGVEAEERAKGSLVAEVLAALGYGEQRGAARARDSVELAPDGRSKTEQQHVASRERQNWELIEARVHELQGDSYIELFAPYFDAFFDRTEPSDWIEAQTFHYVGDALVSDFADVLVPLVDREGQETFALDELTRAMEQDPEAAERIRLYAQRVVGEAFTQTARAMEATEGLRTLMGGQEGGKRLVLLLLDRHRQRLDRLGIDPVDE